MDEPNESGGTVFEIQPGRYLIDFTVLIGDPVSEEKFRAAIALHNQLGGGEHLLSSGVQGDSPADDAAAGAAD